MAEQSRSRSKPKKTLSFALARYLLMMPINVPLNIYDVARSVGRIQPGNRVQRAFATGVLNGFMEYVDGKVIRRFGTYSIADVDLPYNGRILPMPSGLSGGQRALFSTLKVDSLVVLGRVFKGALIVDCADGARLRPGQQHTLTVRSLWRRDALTLICSDEFASYLSVTLDGTSIKRSTDILSM